MNDKHLAPVRTRPLQAGELEPVETVFAGLSTRSRYLRFHTGLPHLPRSMRESLVAVDGRRHVAFVAETAEGEPVGIARFVATSADRAELAVAVVDAWQGRGVGRRLLEALRERAAELGYRQLTAVVLPENREVLHLLRDVFLGARTEVDDGVLQVTSPVDRDAPWMSADELVAT